MNQTNFDQLHSVETGKHLYQFYKAPDDYMAVMISYFQAGLAKGDACLWLVSERMDLDKVKAFAELTVPGFMDFLASGQMKLLSAESWYLTDGRFDQEKAVTNALRFVEEMQGVGYEVVRAAGDAGAIPKDDWHLLHPYEEVVAQFVQKHSVIALCAYPILECTMHETRQIVESHDAVLVGRL